MKVTALAFCFLKEIFIFVPPAPVKKSVFFLPSVSQASRVRVWNRSGRGIWASAMHAEIPYNEIAPKSNYDTE